MHTAPQTSNPADTVAELVQFASARLAEAGIETARLDAEVLLARAWGADRTALYAGWRRRIAAEERDRFAELLARRLAREPLAYITGRQEFWSLEFRVTPDVLIPRPETELLIELALRIPSIGERQAAPVNPLSKTALMLRQATNEPGFETAAEETRPPQPKRGTVHWPNISVPRGSEAQHERDTACSTTLSAHPEPVEGRAESVCQRAPLLCDLGTGSGCIAVALACELPDAEIWALDTSAAALGLARENAARHATAERIHFLQSDLFAALGDLRFDAIISNPPYVASDTLRTAQPELRWEPALALDGGVTGLDVIERVLAESGAHLQDGGWLIMEIGADQGGAVERLARAAAFRTVSIEPDYAGLPRALLARR